MFSILWIKIKLPRRFAQKEHMYNSTHGGIYHKIPCFFVTVFALICHHSTLTLPYSTMGWYGEMGRTGWGSEMGSYVK